MEYRKCGPLCQHPACWYVGEHIADITKKHPGFQQYVEFLNTKRSTREKEDPRASDGMPVLTVSNAVDSVSLATPIHQRRHQSVISRVQNHKRSRQKSELVQSWVTSNSSDAEATNSNKLCSFAQMVLEELPQVVGRQPSIHEVPFADYTFSPVLVWRPGGHSHQQMAERSEQLGSEERPVKKHGKRDSRPVELKTLNLSDMISLKAASEKEHIEAMRKCVKSRRRPRVTHSVDTAALDQYIMEDLQDLPMQSIQQVLQQLHRESVDEDSVSSESSDVSYMAPQTVITEMYDSTTHNQAPHTPTFSHRSSDPQRCGTPHRPSFVKSRSGHFVKMTTRTPPSVSREDVVGSFSRALAAQPREALIEMKARTAALQRKSCANRKPSILAKDKLLADSLDLSTGIFPSFELLSPRPLQSSDTGQARDKVCYPVHRNPSMALRFYHKTPSARRRRLMDALSCPQQTWLLPLPDTPAGIVRWDYRSRGGKTVVPAFTYQPKLSVHVPCEYAVDRPFSEERSTVVHSESQLDGACSATPMSRHSSDHLITSADIASSTGELVLFNQGGDVVHQVTKTDVTSMDIPLIELALLPDMEEGGALASEKDQTDLSGGGSFLEDGTIAPPPTARDPLSDCTIDSDLEDASEVPTHTASDESRHTPII